MAVTPATEAVLEQLRELSIEDKSIGTIRTLSMDAIQRANSGHPGAPMGQAPLAYVLWQRYLKHNPANPAWLDRDRFVLSCGHASMLLYSMLHLSGYALTLDDILRFRQMGSRTPGHPENFHTAGVETTTGPLGQGLSNGVGMALAEAHLAAVFNKPGHAIIDHHTYVFAGDGDLMEGVSHEAASIAGHFGLGKLVVVYDDNRITIDGSTDITYSENAAMRFEAYGWHVVEAGDAGNDLDAIDNALEAARQETARPSLVVLQTHIGYGSPSKQDTSSAHGSPLGHDEIRLTKRTYGWPEDATFLIPPDVKAHMDARERGERAEAEWQDRFDRYRAEFPELAEQLEARFEGAVPDGWDADIPRFVEADGPIATRAASGKVLNGFAHRLPSLIGGSADLTGSNKTLITDSAKFGREHPEGRNVHWGIREHGMCGVSNGMALHGGVRPYAATFLVFTDYARPSIRLAAMMGLPVIYVMTHDSIGLGEDGPTHQPVEHLAALRVIPNLTVIRPADANETAHAWRAAIERTDGPTVLVLSRQKLPVLDDERLGDSAGTTRGAYVLSKETGDSFPDIVLIATGSEVPLALDTQKSLQNEGLRARVVSMPSWELFRDQPEAYRDEVLPPEVGARLAIEAAAEQGWREWVGEGGGVVAMRSFGASAPASALFEHFGFSLGNAVERAKALLR